MAFRVDVLAGGEIEIMRPREGRRAAFPRFETLDQALIVIRFLLRRDLQEAKDQAFTPKAVIEARKAFQQLSERSPYRGQK
jgi:hypothetical protein